MFPPQLYVPRPADIQSGILLGRFVFLNTQTGAAQHVFDIQPLTPNAVLELTHVEVLADPGAAITVTRMRAWVADASSSAPTARIFDFQNLTGIAAGAINSLSTIADGPALQIPLIILPGEKLTVTVDFSGVDVLNASDCSGYGFQYPRGSWQRAVAAN